MKELFSIGEVAAFAHISKQTLIYYDQIGLFPPAFTDPKNGYRYYSSAQLDLLDTILLLKRCGLSLNAIRQQLQTRTLKSSDALFARQQADIEAQIRQLQLLHARICAKRKTLAPLLKESDAPPIRQTVTQGHVLLCEPVDPPYQLSDISIATKRCFSRAFHQQLPIHFQIGVSVPLAHLRNDRCMEATLAFLPMDASAAAHADLVLPEGTCVIGTHHGRYDQIHHTYAQIFAFCKQQHLTIVSDSYEFCLHDHLTGADEQEYITQILLYVHTADATDGCGIDAEA